MTARTIAIAIAFTGCTAAAGCGSTSTSEPTSTPASANASAMVDASPAGTATMNPAVAAAVRSAKDVAKMKIRLNADGEMIKQSVYHGDASTIAGPARELAETTFPGGTARRYETEWYAEHGEVHEIEVDTKDGKRCEVAAKPDGTKLYVECHETEASLPDAVKTTITTTFPDGRVLEVESTTGPAIDASFTIEVESGGVEYYLVISPAGEIQHKYKRVPAIVEVPVD